VSPDSGDMGNHNCPPSPREAPLRDNLLDHAARTARRPVQPPAAEFVSSAAFRPLPDPNSANRSSGSPDAFRVARPKDRALRGPRRQVFVCGVVIGLRHPLPRAAQSNGAALQRMNYDRKVHDEPGGELTVGRLLRSFVGLPAVILRKNPIFGMSHTPLRSRLS